MNRGALIGMVGGAAVFIIIIFFIFYGNSSFDQRLIDQVEDGVPAEELIPQIDNETVNLKMKAKTRLEQVVTDRKYWGNGELATSDHFDAYITSYEFELRIIDEYDKARKRYANRETTKRQFLSEIQGSRDYYEIYKY